MMNCFSRRLCSIVPTCTSSVTRSVTFGRRWLTTEPPTNGATAPVERSTGVATGSDLIQDIFNPRPRHAPLQYNVLTGSHQSGPKDSYSSSDTVIELIASTAHPRPLNEYVVHVSANRNNTVCALTDEAGRVITRATAGMVGLRKAARGTSDAGYLTVIHLTEKAAKLDLAKTKTQYHHKNAVNLPEAIRQGVHLKLKGFGPGRDQAFRAIIAAGWKITRITDVTPVRHGGCRPPKKRRL